MILVISLPQRGSIKYAVNVSLPRDNNFTIPVLLLISTLPFLLRHLTPFFNDTLKQ